jgi:uncharacterized protein YbjT (DUF2867 family)
MAEHVLVTGGAGFIGSHLGDELLRAGYRVRALDRLVEQVHGDAKRPEYLGDEIELIAGDVRNAEVVRGALEGVDAVVHLAARSASAGACRSRRSAPPRRRPARCRPRDEGAGALLDLRAGSRTGSLAVDRRFWLTWAVRPCLR